MAKCYNLPDSESYWCYSDVRNGAVQVCDEDIQEELSGSSDINTMVLGKYKKVPLYYPVIISNAPGTPFVQIQNVAFNGNITFGSNYLFAIAYACLWLSDECARRVNNNQNLPAVPDIKDIQIADKDLERIIYISPFGDEYQLVYPPEELEENG